MGWDTRALWAVDDWTACFLVTASLPRAEHVNGTGKPRRSAASLFQPGPEKQRGWRFAVLSLLLHASGTRASC